MGYARLGDCAPDRARSPDNVDLVIGGIIFVVAMVIVVPVGVMFAGAAWSAVLGWSASCDFASPKSDESE